MIQKLSIIVVLFFAATSAHAVNLALTCNLKTGTEEAKDYISFDDGRLQPIDNKDNLNLTLSTKSYKVNVRLGTSSETQSLITIENKTDGTVIEVPSLFWRPSLKIKKQDKTDLDLVCYLDA